MSIVQLAFFHRSCIPSFFFSYINLSIMKWRTHEFHQPSFFSSPMADISICWRCVVNSLFLAVVKICRVSYFFLLYLRQRDLWVLSQTAEVHYPHFLQSIKLVNHLTQNTRSYRRLGHITLQKVAYFSPVWLIDLKLIQHWQHTRWSKISKFSGCWTFCLKTPLINHTPSGRPV